jgi:hypothetical protein
VQNHFLFAVRPAQRATDTPAGSTAALLLLKFAVYDGG